MEATLVLGLFIAFLTEIFDTGTAQQTDCACYGNDVAIDSIKPNCSTSGEIIAIDSVYRAAKLSNTGCPNPADSTNRDEATCCTYNSETDCRIDLTSGDIPTVFSDCQGASTCSKQVTWQETASHCNSGYLAQTNYMCMEYFCFPTADALGFCDTTGTTVSETVSYFYNDDYPASVSHTDCCACVITASAASATIDLDLIDLRLYDATSTCMQTVFISDNSNLVTYICADNNDFTIKKLLTSNGSSLTVTLKSNASASGNGHAWFRATVSNGGLTTTCSSVAQCPDNTTTTTTTAAATTTATATTQTSSDPTEETWFFGLSVTISIMMLSGLFFVLLLMSLLCCTLCYECGKSKSFKITQVRSESTQRLNPDNTRNSPDSFTQYSCSSGCDGSVTGISVTPRSVKSVDLDLRSDIGVASRLSKRTGMFVYRPFENRSALRSYFRRPSLTRIESP